MDTKISVVEKGALARVGALFVEAFGHSPALVVSDGNTLGIGGFALIQSLEQKDIQVRQCCFAALPQVYADEHSIERVRHCTNIAFFCFFIILIILTAPSNPTIPHKS